MDDKMKILFQSLHAINKTDYWLKLFNSFEELKDNPWYPVPVLENPDEVLRYYSNDDIASD
jgi:hypothetical protein